MDYRFSEEAEILKTQLAKFIEQELKPVAAKIDFDNELPTEILKPLRKRSAQLGFWAAHIPQELGGGGLDNVTMSFLRETSFASGCLLAFVATPGPEGPSLILSLCNGDQRKRLVDPLINGESTTCFCLTEPNAGSDAQAISTRAEKSGSSYIINGSKLFITNAKNADFAIVFAVTNSELRAHGGVSAFLVEKGTPGFQVGNVQVGMGGVKEQYEVFFENCKVPAENLLGEEGMAFITAMQFLGAGRLAIGAWCVGWAQYLLDISIEYAKTRNTFGKPLSTRQVIQFKIADMQTQLYAARNMLYHASWLADQGDPIVKESSMVKLFCSEMLGFVVDEALQIHGGAGWMKELPIERLYRIARVLRIVEGASEIQRMIISRSLL